MVVLLPERFKTQLKALSLSPSAPYAEYLLPLFVGDKASMSCHKCQASVLVGSTLFSV